MLEMYSWRDFLFATGLMVMAWYALVGLVFYRQELQSVFRIGVVIGDRGLKADRGGGKVAVPPLAGDGEVLDVGAGKEFPEGLMGARKLPEGMSVVTVGQVCFADPGGSKVHQLGMVSDVVQEISEVFAFLKEKGGGKREFLFLLEEVAGRYPGIAGFPSLASINAHVLEHAPFELSVSELMEVWG
ncbi:MAG: hypothetical protein EOP48_03035 [Sphingobacteriales bacterium]|nr:MAG: hypothetical protein EOP48_03035 [Sphingobacteriales bacterium]